MFLDADDDDDIHKAQIPVRRPRSLKQIMSFHVMSIHVYIPLARDMLDKQYRLRRKYARQPKFDLSLTC